MSIGMVIKNADGETVIGPDTFTVRLVEAKAVNYGRMAAGTTLDVPFSSNIKAGMFVQLVPLFQYPLNKNMQGSRAEIKAVIDGVPSHRHEHIPDSAVYCHSDYYPCLPSAQVYDGFVRLFASSIRGNCTLANVAIYVMTNI